VKMSNFHRLGIDISPKDYTLDEIKNFHKALDKADYASYIRSFKWSEPRYTKYTEGIEFDIQTSAFSKSNILNSERVCVIFAKDEKPMVLSVAKGYACQPLFI